MVNTMKKILSLVLCFCFLFAAPLSIAAKTVTASKHCSSPKEVFELKSITEGSNKIKVKKGEGGSGLRFTAQEDGNYTFKFSNFKCKTDKDAGTCFLFDLVEEDNSEFVVINTVHPLHITNFEKTSASAKIKFKLKKNQTIYISVDPSAQYIEDYELPMGGYLYKAFSFKLNIKRS